MPTITARYAARCDRCSADIGRGDTIGYEKPRAWCGACWRVVEGRRAEAERLRAGAVGHAKATKEPDA